MERLKQHADHYLDGIITGKEFFAHVVGTLANHWESIPDDAQSDDFANQLAVLFWYHIVFETRKKELPMDEARNILLEYDEGFISLEELIIKFNGLIQRKELPETTAWAMILQIAVDKDCGEDA